MPTTTQTTTPAPAPPSASASDTASHHARLDKFLAILERLTILAVTIGPAIARPLVPPATAAIIDAEAPVALEILTELESAPASA